VEDTAAPAARAAPAPEQAEAPTDVPAVAPTEAPAETRPAEAEAREAQPAAPEPPAPEQPAAAPRKGKAKAAPSHARAPEPPAEPAPRAPAAPAAPAAAVETQDVVMTGGSPFIRTLGFIQRAGGEPLPGLENVVVSKMLSHPLPTEPGTYEYRFTVRNGTGEFELMQRTPQGAVKNKRKFAPDPSAAFQAYTFSIP
jgi:hypothetical protein